MNRILNWIVFVFFLLGPFCLKAQNVYPNVTPTARYVTSEGEEIEDASEEQSAPITGYFSAEVTDQGLYSAHYEWRIFRVGQENSPLVDRFDREMEYTFTQSGTFYVQLYVTFVQGTDTIRYPDGGGEPFVVSVSQSKLEFPNAFSPNGDGFNDVYKAKEGYRSIVKFKATVFTRWGQKVYTWTNPAEGWDGKINGRTARDGVYYVVVQAEGADGRKFNIRKDVNVLTGYSGEGGTTDAE
ncbi:MAG: gliding motility-associated C-terminal domain-containing protein [Candidatus Paraprevotella stercoravium]|uniref:Gliding motility-associated C-terminal domain-containing protein n=1 Tax=Candidatus Paraprevotella stercoravium TaxID=2838725 RepID=A0A9E2L6F8_9BACT|nr:gliding motility-associated C-terminal domain-containing protein [Candidatus Paraprevotella stercoravium]